MIKELFDSRNILDIKEIGIKFMEDHVKESTPKSINRKIEKEISNELEYYSNRSKKEIKEKIAELDKKWDIERTLETNASIIALTGLLLSRKSKKFLIIPAVVMSFLLQHALQGWCPPLPLFRALGIRTRKELEDEKCKLKGYLN